MPEVSFAGGVFAPLHAELLSVQIDFNRFNPQQHDPDWLDFAIRSWAVRVQTEFRSIQVMTRFTQELLGAGDPLDVYAGAVDAIADEVRHTTLCVHMLQALGGVPRYPDPIHEPEQPEFLALPMAQRAAATAVSMLAISETLSTGFIEDLQQRCTEPIVRAVLDATLADEDAHEAYGWGYLHAALQRFDGGRDYFREVAAFTLQPHLETYGPVLQNIPENRRHLEAFPEPAAAELGVLSPEREALLFRQTLIDDVLPGLGELDLCTPMQVSAYRAKLGSL